MQGTIATYDAGSGAGTLFLDDGATLRFGPETTIEARHLRPGQRVHLHRDAGGTITSLRLF